MPPLGSAQTAERNIFQVTPESENALLLCEAVLEPYANSLTGTGETFEKSLCEAVCITQEAIYPGDLMLSTEFTAHKLETNGLGGFAVKYGIEIVFTRPRTETEWWPAPQQDDPLDPEEIIDLDLYQEELDEADQVVSDGLRSIQLVRETHHLAIATNDLTPEKTVSYEYFSMAEEEFGECALPFDDSFSEDDVSLIEAVCDQNFTAAILLVEASGGWDMLAEQDY